MKNCNFQKKNRNILKKTGFTLLEMMISIALFTIVITIALTALLTIIDANEKAKAIKLVVNNLGMAMESMTREIRMGYQYTCGSLTPSSSGVDCSGGTRISFKTQEQCSGYYRYDAGTKAIVGRIRKKDGGVCDNSPEMSITGEDIIVDDLKFYVVGSAQNDGLQPRVLIKLKGSMGVTSKVELNTIFNIQTTVSQRKLAP